MRSGAELRVRTTWIITHERDLEPDESMEGLSRPDPDQVLWAIDEGVVMSIIEVIEG